MIPRRTPTHVEFLDGPLRGGTHPVGVYGIIGPPKAGKSTLASMIAANGATGESIFGKPLYTELPCILFDLHNRQGVTERRTISHIGKIHRDDVWCESEYIQPYEEQRQDELPTENGILIPSSERRDLARKALCDQLIVLPYDKRPPFSSPATQEWIAERTASIAFQIRGLGGIVIDGAQDVWRASQDKTNLSEREFLSQLPAHFCGTLARRFQCPVWITYETCPDKWNVPPTTQLTPEDAAGCKSFADSMDACFVMGTASEPDPDRDVESVFSIQCTKWSPNISHTYTILLKHDRDFSSIVEANNYMEDSCNKTWKKISD